MGNANQLKKKDICLCDCCTCLIIDECYDKQHGCCSELDSFGEKN